MEFEAVSKRWSSGLLPPALEKLLAANPLLSERLAAEARAIWFELCGTAPRLKGKKGRDFFIQVQKEIQALEDTPLRDLILQWALNLSVKSWTLILPFFKAVKVLENDESFLDLWASFCRFMAAVDIDLAICFMNQTPQFLRSHDPDEILPWGERAMNAVAREKSVWKAARAYLEESSSRQCSIPPGRWDFLLDQAARISKPGFREASEAFIRAGAGSCMILNDDELAAWVTQGLEMAQGHRPEEYQGFMKRGMGYRKVEPDLITSYFSGSSMVSASQRDQLASGLSLREKANTLTMICEAFLGRPVKLRENRTLLGVRGFNGGAATDGLTIYLPASLPNFGAYKLIALHQTALLQDPVWQNGDDAEINPLALHLEADRLLLEKLPGLRHEMQRMSPEGLPDYYPHNIPQQQGLPLPWWGEILPHLASQTRDAIRQVVKMASDDDIDLPPEILEALLSSMMAEGERDPNSLWGRIQEMFSTLEFISPDAEDLHETFKTFFYKEWDSDLGDYKLDWTLVRQRFPKIEPNDFVAKSLGRLSGLVSLIRRQFTLIKPEQFKKYRAQPYGDDIDLDALIEAIVEMRAGGFLSDNVYIRRDKRVRDVGVLFLLDLSASTEEMVEGRRVIDIQKEAMVLMAEALETLEDSYSIFGFCSEGRFRVDTFVVKDFNEPFGEVARYRLGNLQPKGLTRLGAVIRHATYRLATLPTAIKLMIILTDGRPYDLEYGDVNYAIEDTKKAVREARMLRINPFIITSDKVGASYLNRISPQSQSIILPKVELLPKVLPAMYKRLTT